MNIFLLYIHSYEILKFQYNFHLQVLLYFLGKPCCIFLYASGDIVDFFLLLEIPNFFLLLIFEYKPLLIILFFNYTTIYEPDLRSLCPLISPYDRVFKFL